MIIVAAAALAATIILTAILRMQVNVFHKNKNKMIEICSNRAGRAGRAVINRPVVSNHTSTSHSQINNRLASAVGNSSVLIDAENIENQAAHDYDPRMYFLY